MPDIGDVRREPTALRTKTLAILVGLGVGWIRTAGTSDVVETVAGSDQSTIRARHLFTSRPVNPDLDERGAVVGGRRQCDLPCFRGGQCRAGHDCCSSLRSGAVTAHRCAQHPSDGSREVARHKSQFRFQIRRGAESFECLHLVSVDVRTSQTEILPGNPFCWHAVVDASERLVDDALRALKGCDAVAHIHVVEVD